MAAETYQAYLPQIKRRWENEPQVWEQNRQQALIIAKKMVAMLREQYSVSRVILFGSLVESGRFDQFSDIDLAVEGLDPSLFYQAVSRLQALSQNFQVDLIDLAHCPHAFREAILGEGVLL
ncbi:MAG: nucleotidyltransferase domain-containing protein [Chloroflexota bacterium]